MRYLLSVAVAALLVGACADSASKNESDADSYRTLREIMDERRDQPFIAKLKWENTFHFDGVIYWREDENVRRWDLLDSGSTNPTSGSFLVEHSDAPDGTIGESRGCLWFRRPGSISASVECTPGPSVPQAFLPSLLNASVTPLESDSEDVECWALAGGPLNNARACFQEGSIAPSLLSASLKSGGVELLVLETEQSLEGVIPEPGTDDEVHRVEDLGLPDDVYFGNE